MSYAEYGPVAQQAAAQSGINVDYFVRQIDEESHFDPYAQSSAGAIGIAQIVPRWHPGVDPWDPRASLYYAANLMRGLLDKYGGNYCLALAAYNAGAGTVDQYGGVPPYAETQQYVQDITGGQCYPDAAANPQDGQTGAPVPGQGASEGPNPLTTLLVGAGGVMVLMLLVSSLAGPKYLPKRSAYMPRLGSASRLRLGS